LWTSSEKPTAIRIAALNTRLGSDLNTTVIEQKLLRENNSSYAIARVLLVQRRRELID
jgi:hypothetical protein